MRVYVKGLFDILVAPRYTMVLPTKARKRIKLMITARRMNDGAGSSTSLSLSDLHGIVVLLGLDPSDTSGVN